MTKQPSFAERFPPKNAVPHAEHVGLGSDLPESNRQAIILKLQRLGQSDETLSGYSYGASGSNPVFKAIDNYIDTSLALKKNPRNAHMNPTVHEEFKARVEAAAENLRSIMPVKSADALIDLVDQGFSKNGVAG